jgi:hypothetical protein
MDKTYDPENDGFADYERDYDLLALDPDDPDNYEDEDDPGVEWGEDETDLDPSEDDLEGEEEYALEGEEYALEGEEDEDDPQGGDDGEVGWDDNGDEEEWDEDEE